MQKKVCFALKLFMVWAVFNVMFYAVQGDFWGYGQLFIRVSLELIIFTLLIFNYQYFTRDLLSRMIMIWIVYSSVVTAYHSDYVAKDLSESLWWPLMYILFFLVGRYPKLLKTFIHKYVPVLIVLSFVMFFFTSRTKDGERFCFFIKARRCLSFLHCVRLFRCFLLKDLHFLYCFVWGYCLYTIIILKLKIVMVFSKQ